MSLQRSSIRGEHTHTLTVVAVSLYEQTQDRIYHSSWQRRSGLNITDQAPLTVLVSITLNERLRGSSSSASTL